MLLLDYIQKAFLKIAIEESRKNSENINDSEETKTLRFERAMIQLTCSLFLLNASIKAHIYINDETLTFLSQFLRDLYDDDTVTSFEEFSIAT